MKAQSVFVGLLSVFDGRHDQFLDWHELDHRPENHGLIEHLFHSERFVLSPAASAEVAGSGAGVFADAGQYLMTYWSRGTPEQLSYDMTVVREQLASQGRCAPINRDFRATWRQRMHVASGYSSPRHLASPDAALLTNHHAVVVTIGHYADGDGRWRQWYDRTGVGQVFADEAITAAYTLMPNAAAATEPFVHLHYATRESGAQETVARAYREGSGAAPDVLFQATFVAQHAGQPRFYV